MRGKFKYLNRSLLAEKFCLKYKSHKSHITKYCENNIFQISIFKVFFALLIHKTIVGFSLGLRLVQSRLHPPTVVLCCAVFSLQVCIGGFTGLAVLKILSGSPLIFLISGILQVFQKRFFNFLFFRQLLVVPFFM